ncbi:MAG TPA: MarR family winged helix-turn-helix transcriptional regulator [Acidimicrobiia bacterium]
MARRNPGPPSSPAVAPRGDSRRYKILKYLAGHGGELRSDTGLGLRRQIADALGERPTAVSQTLIALERAGLVDRELDVSRQRCYAIRLTAAAQPLRFQHQPHDGTGSTWDFDLSERSGKAMEMSNPSQHLEADLDSARQELKDAIRKATKVSRRVRELELALWRAGQRQPVSP